MGFLGFFAHFQECFVSIHFSLFTCAAWERVHNSSHVPFVTLPKFNYRQLTNILLARNFAFSHQPHTQVSAMLLLDTVDDQLLLSFKNYAANFSFSCRPALNTFVQRNSWPHNCVLLHGTFEHNERSIQFEHNLLLGKTIQLISVVECSNGK